MALPLVLGAAALGGIAGGLSKSKGKMVSTLDPTQQGIYNNMASNISQGARPYSGQMSMDFSPGEQDVVNNYARLSALQQPTLERLSNYDDTAFNQQFQEEMTNPTLRSFRNDIQPLIEETLPTFSTARGNAVARSLGDIQGNLLTQRFNARESAKDRALNAIGVGSQQAQTALGIAAAPREVAQAGLDRAYNEFTRQEQSRADYVNSGLSFLGIQTQAYEEPQASTWQKVLSGAMSGAQLGSSLSSGLSSLKGGGGTYAPSYTGSASSGYRNSVFTRPRTTFEL